MQTMVIVAPWESKPSFGCQHRVAPHRTAARPPASAGAAPAGLVHGTGGSSPHLPGQARESPRRSRQRYEILAQLLLGGHAFLPRTMVFLARLG